MMNDFFSKEEVCDILDDSGNKLGTDIITYNILKVLSAKNLQSQNIYSVTVKHRVLIDGVQWNVSQNYQTDGFSDYPIMVNVQSKINSVSQPGTKIVLKRIFPKTINAIVEQSTNISTGNSSSQTNQTSSGSQLSNVNTFGVDMSVGWFVEGPTASLGINYSHSWEHGTSNSKSFSDTREHNHQSASGTEMSVKDWSAYSSVHSYDNSGGEGQGPYVEWNWGQTYPWSIFDFNEKFSGTNILMPKSVIANLIYFGDTSNSNGKNILMPPSDLSLFGLDFTMASEWLITFPQPLTSSESVSFQHEVSVTQASHSMMVPDDGSQANLIASVTPAFTNVYPQSTPLVLGEYALVPLSGNQSAGISFQNNLFDIAPGNTSGEFKIRSRGNDLLVTGAGFSAGMMADFPADYSGTGATLTISLKVADINAQYGLILKHWIGQDSGNVVLTFLINGNKTIINITDSEGQGSLNNINQLDLRNFDLKSSNFHDYLQPGWNEIVMTVLPQNKKQLCRYHLLALSVES